MLASFISFLSDLVSVQNGDKVLLIIFPSQLSLKFCWVYLFSLVRVWFNAFVLYASSVVIRVVVVFGNLVQSWWALVLLYLLSDFLFHSHLLAGVFFFDLFLELFEFSNFIVVSRQSFDFVLALGFSLCNASFLFGFSFNFGIVEAFLKLSFLLAEELNVLLLLKASMFVQSQNLVVNSFVNFSFMILWGDVVDTLQTVLLLNFSETLLITHSKKKYEF